MTQDGKISIVPDENGSVIRVSKTNPEFGYVRLVQDKTFIGPGNWVKNQNRSTLIHGTVEQLQAVGLGSAKTLPGQIVIKEQVNKPFNDNDPDRDLKIAGDTGIVCEGVDPETGEVGPIYRKSFYSANMNEEDTLIPHINGEAIRQANSDTKALSQKDLNAIVENKPKSRRKKAEETVVETPVAEEVIEEEVVAEVDVEDDTFEL